MPQEESERPAPRDGAAKRDPRARRVPLARIRPIAAAAGVGVALGLVILGVTLVVRDDDEADPGPRADARAASIDDLNAFASEAGHPVYWAGPQPRFTYELSETGDGRVYIRYLPPGTEAGDPGADYLTVGTYPLEDAFATLQATAKAQEAETFELPRGGLAFQDANRPTSVYLAFPDSEFQVEVYAPDPDAARGIVEAGQIKPLGAPPPTSAPAEAVSADDLAALPAELGHPVYWAGDEPDATYELTQTSDGSVYVRYLPPDVDVGARRADYLTVATYRQEDALEALETTAADNEVETIAVPNGGRALVEEESATSVWVAFPDEDVQIEVYHPDPERALELVTAGRIVPAR